jgi:ABC-2 type transport system permease protein
VIARTFAVAAAEVRRFAADRGDLALSLFVPIAIFALMMGAFGGATSFSATAYVVNADIGARGADLVDRTRNVDGVTVKLLRAAEAERRLDRSAILNVFLIPADFSAKVAAGDPVAVTVRRRGNGGEQGQIVASILRAFAQEVAVEAAARRYVQDLAAASPAGFAQVDAVLDAAIQRTRTAPPVSVQSEVIGFQSVPINRMLVGILAMFLLFSVTLGARNLVEDKRLGTLERLMTTRLSANQLFAGRFLAGIGRAILQMSVLLLLAFIALRSAPATAFLSVLLVGVLVAAAVSAIGLVIGAAARTPDQATWIAVFVTMSMSIFGGVFFETGTEGVMATISRFTLNRYAIALMDSALARGSIDWAGQLSSLLVIAGVALVGLAVARMLFRVAAEH